MSWIEEWVKEYDKTRDRIGKTTADAMNWVLRLAQTPIETLSTGDFANLAAEIDLFVRGGAGKGHPFAVVEQGYPKAMGQHAPDKQLVKELQNIVLERVNELLADTSTGFSFGKFRLVVASVRSMRSLMFPLIETRQEGFTYYLAHLLGEHGYKIGKCPECQGLFLAIRLHQRFCSPRCRSRAGTREFRKAERRVAKIQKPARTKHSVNR